MDYSPWKNQTVFVTGATGHIGGWLVKRLKTAGAKVVCLVRDWEPECELMRTGLIDQVTVVRGDVTDLELLRSALVDKEIGTVFHLAAQSIVSIANREPVNTFETNIRGTWSMLEACRLERGDINIVVASTDKVYGESNQLPYSEEMPMMPVYPHDVSKACAEMIVECYNKTYNLRTTVLRLPNIYGGGDLNWSRIIPGTIRSILCGERPVINSNGRFIRDYLFVEDAVAGLLLLAERLADTPSIQGQAFNISSETHMTVLALVERILRLTGSPLQPEIRDQVKNEIKNQYMSAAKLKQMTGWKLSFTMDEGLEHTIEWYKDYLAGQAM